MTTVESKKKPLEIRRIYINQRPAHKIKFSSNKVSTSKYNIITFLPKNIVEQFYGIANFYFLILIVLQMFPLFKEVSFIITAMPMIIIVSATAIKVQNE
jgi:phospholipid-translocating ATPase